MELHLQKHLQDVSHTAELQLKGKLICKQNFCYTHEYSVLTTNLYLTLYKNDCISLRLFTSNTKRHLNTSLSLNTNIHQLWINYVNNLH